MISKFLIILVLLAAGFHYFGQGVNLRTDEAIAKELVPAGMNTLQTEELRDIIKTERKPILLLIYASWCPYCKKQMEALRSIHLSNKNLRIIALSTDREPDDLQRYLQKIPPLPFEYPLYVGREDMRNVIRSYGGNFSGAIPYMGLFKRGKMVAGISGYTEESELKKILAEN